MIFCSFVCLYFAYEYFSVFGFCFIKIFNIILNVRESVIDGFGNGFGSWAGTWVRVWCEGNSCFFVFLFNSFFMFVLLFVVLFSNVFVLKRREHS